MLRYCKKCCGVSISMCVARGEHRWENISVSEKGRKGADLDLEAYPALRKADNYTILAKKVRERVDIKERTVKNLLNLEKTFPDASVRGSSAPDWLRVWATPDWW